MKRKHSQMYGSDPGSTQTELGSSKQKPKKIREWRVGMPENPKPKK